jgi:hypothetical protein
MIASATGLPALSRKTPAQEGAGEELLVGTSRKKTARQITEFLKKGIRRKSKAARMLPLLNQSRLRTFLAVPVESSGRTVRMPRPRSLTYFLQENVEVMDILYIAHTMFHACSSERRFLARKRAVLARTFHIAKSRGFKETIVPRGVDLA